MPLSLILAAALLSGPPGGIVPLPTPVGSLAIPAPMPGLVVPTVNIKNIQLCGKLLDFTHNHGGDRRVFSEILCKKRDLYVYLPPGYNPGTLYPLVLVLHGAFGDEQSLLSVGGLEDLDRGIACGRIPPMILAAPDGIVSGEGGFNAEHSFFINGCLGRFEDHIWQEVIPFMHQHFSIRPEREAHGIMGDSAGGFGAFGLAIKYKGYFGAVAGLAPAVNLRYGTCRGKYFDDFSPSTYRPQEYYNPKLIIGKYALGVISFRAQRFIDAPFGPLPFVTDNIKANNPTDLLCLLNPGELAMYIHYPGKDNFNFDAHVESFAYQAALRGIHVETACKPHAIHLNRYFIDHKPMLYQWMGSRLLPAVPIEYGPVSLGGPAAAVVAANDAGSTNL